jgi:hypothetical protein
MVQGLGLGVQGLEFRVYGSGLGAWGSGFRVLDSSLHDPALSKG